MQLTKLLTQSGASEAPALVFEGTTFSRDQLAQDVAALVHRFEGSGIGPGCKVLVALPNSPGFLIALLAVNECGAVFMPINPKLTADERRRIDEIARPDFVIADEGSVELLPGIYLSRTGWEPYTDDDLRNVAAIIFTSGTTGIPKGVMMAGESLVANARSVARYLDLSERDRTLVFLPVFYTYTLSQILATWIAGGSVVLMRNLLYPVQAFSAIADHRITGFGGVPMSLSILATQARESAFDRTSLRYILSAGGPLAPAVLEAVQNAFPKAALFNNYGCTEIGPRATAVDCAAQPEKARSIGRAIPGVNVTIVRPDLSVAAVRETGEIVLNGPSLMKGYYRDPDTTVARMSHHGFHTGDYAYADADGFLYFQGRRDDIFKTAGEKVSAREIEDVVMGHEAVVEAAVVSRPDRALGAVPVVYVVLRAGRTCSERELRAFCARHLSSHKVPRTVHFVEELHKTATGKIQKHRLKEAYL